MTTAETTNATRRSSSSAKGATDIDAAGLPEARHSVENAATELIGATNETLRSLVPAAVLRPVTTVEYGFDLAEQLLVNTRRTCVELARMLEGGIDRMGARAA